MIVEGMGRDAGWVAAAGGLAGGADMILVPEVPFTTNEVCEIVRRRHARGRTFSIVVVAEGARRSGFGVMVALVGTKITTVSLEEALAGSKHLDLEVFGLSRLFH